MPQSPFLPPNGSSRRQFVGLAAAAAGAVAFMSSTELVAGAAKKAESSGLDAKLFERILRAPAKDADGVVTVSIGRNDIDHATAPGGVMKDSMRVPFNTAFELGGEMVFQRVGDGRAMLNGDFVFLADEINPAIDAMLLHGLELQALHQHYFDVRPMVWFMHFRGVGTPEALARAGAAVVAATATKLPQTDPGKQRSPLPKDAIGKILGADAEVAEHGVLQIVVPRTDVITLGGMAVKPHLNVSSNISMQPLDGGMAAAAPDFAMKSSEVHPVIATMRRHGWAVHCLYNQETAETPQLYFAHMMKTGDPIALAREMRDGLDQTATKRA